MGLVLCVYAEQNRIEGHIAASTCLEHLRISAEWLNLFENAMVWVPTTSTSSLHLNYCNRFSHCCAILFEEARKKKPEVDNLPV